MAQVTLHYAKTGSQDFLEALLKPNMLRGKENGGNPRRIHIWVYLFIIREWGYTSPPQEIHFLYNEKFNFLFLNFVCKPTRLFSLPLCVIKSIAFSSIFSHVGLLFLCLTFIKCVLMSLKSLSVQIIPDFPLQPSRSFFSATFLVCQCSVLKFHRDGS